jgi:hypothetical protein
MCFTILDVKVPLKRESDFNNQTLCKALSQKITCVTVGWILVGSNQQDASTPKMIEALLWNLG